MSIRPAYISAGKQLTKPGGELNKKTGVS